MKPDPDSAAEELAQLREEQQFLRSRLEFIDERLTRLERTAALQRPEPATEPPIAPPPLPPLPPPIVASGSASESVELRDPATPPPLPDFGPTGGEATLDVDRSAHSDPQPIGELPRGEVATKGGSGDDHSFEVRFGQVWLVRIGIVVLLTGLVFLGNLAWSAWHQEIGALGRLLALAIVAGLMAAAGFRVGRRGAGLRNFGRVLIGGGLALGYYTLYAAHFVDTLRVIESPLLGGFLLLLGAMGMLWLAEKVQSQSLAAITVTLAFYTAAINPLSQFSLFSNIILSLAALVLLIRNQWVLASFASLIGTYLAFVFWRVQQGGIGGNEGTELGYLVCYWAIFTASAIVGGPTAYPRGSRVPFITLNNVAFAILAGARYREIDPDSLWLVTSLFGLIVAGLAAVPSLRKQPAVGAGAAYLAQGITIFSLGILWKLTGYQIAVVFAGMSLAFLSASRHTYPRTLRIFSWLAGVVAVFAVGLELLDDSTYARPVALVVFGVLLGIVYLIRHSHGLLTQNLLRWSALPFAINATAVTFFLCLDFFQGRDQIIAIMTLAVGLTYMSRPARLAEIAIAAIALAVAGQAQWALEDFISEPDGVAMTAVILPTMLLILWWQRWSQRESTPILRTGACVILSLFSIPPLVHWISTVTPDRFAAPALAGAALAILLFGRSLNAWGTVLIGGIATVAAALQTSAHVSAKLPWESAALAIVLIAAQNLILSSIPGRKNGIETLAVRVVVVALGTHAVFTYMDEKWFPVVLLASASLAFVLGCLLKRKEAFAYAAILVVLGFAAFVMTGLTAEAYFPQVLGFVAVLVGDIVGRRTSDPLKAMPRIRSTIVVLSIVGIWIVTGRSAAAAANDLLVTASWSGIAFLAFVAGFALRDRVYRMTALAIVIAAVGRVYVVDVWNLDTFGRVISFLALGCVLIGLGFLYNRYAEFIRRLL